MAGNEFKLEASHVYELYTKALQQVKVADRDMNIDWLNTGSFENAFEQALDGDVSALQEFNHQILQTGIIRLGGEKWQHDEIIHLATFLRADQNYCEQVKDYFTAQGWSPTPTSPGPSSR